METNKYIALLEEFDASNKLIRLGFGELQNINLGNDFYFLPFQLLSQGFERFMKAYICVGYFNQKQKFPDDKHLRGLGHDLERLRTEITDNYFTDFDRPQFYIDKDFISSNLDLKELLFILSEFGKVSRYYNFDLITGSTKIGINTKECWENFQSKVLNKNDYEKLLDFNISHEVYQKITNHVIIIFKKFISALSRQFIFKCLGQEGLRLSSKIAFDFGKLYENDYGNRDYRKETTKYKETPKKIRDC